MEKKNNSGSKGRKIIRRISIALFLCVLILPQTTWIILKLVCGSESQIMEKLDYDLGENRELVAFPHEAGIKNITSELEEYYNDHAPYRSVLITINRRINTKLERAYTLNVQPVLVALADNKNSISGSKGTDAENSNEGYTEPENGTLFAGRDKENEGLAGSDNTDVNAGSNGGDRNNYGGNAGDKNNSDSNISDVDNLGSNTTSGGDKYGSDISDVDNLDDNTANDGDNSGSNIDDRDNSSGNTEDRNNSSGNMFDGKSEGTPAGSETDSKYAAVEKEKGTEKADNASSELPYFPAREMNGTIFGRDDWMFCSYDNSIDYYCGNNLMTEQQMKDRLSLMQKLQQICDSRGVKLEFLIAPNKEQVYSEYMPTYTIKNNYKRVPRFIDYVRQNSSVKIIYPIEELQAAKNTMSNYYKYDTHWNHYGSFIATQALYKDMGLEYVNPDSVPYSDASCIWGLVITAGLSWQDYERDYDHIPTYKPEVELFNTDGEIDHVHTEKSAVYRTDSTASNDSRFVMIGDSFRLYMMPYFERDFAHVSIAHRDNINDIREDISQADILVIECVERLDDSLNGTLLSVIDILEGR